MCFSFQKYVFTNFIMQPTKTDPCHGLGMSYPPLCCAWISLYSFLCGCCRSPASSTWGRHILSSWVLAPAPLPQEGLLDPQAGVTGRVPTFLCSASHHHPALFLKWMVKVCACQEDRTSLYLLHLWTGRARYRAAGISPVE